MRPPGRAQVTGGDQPEAATGRTGCGAILAAAGAAARSGGSLGATGHPRSDPASVLGLKDCAAPTPGDPAAAAPNFRQSFLLFLLEPARDSVWWLSAPSTSTGRGGAGAKRGVLNPRLVLAASLRQPEFYVSALPPASRPAPANPQARCPARRDPVPNEPPVSGSHTRGAAGVPGDGRSGPAYLKTSRLLQLTKVRPKSPGKSQGSSCS